jgi:deazaflavin-dependent oxidoreductase (nitroreductase family)
MQKRLFRTANSVGVWVYRVSKGRLANKARGGSPVMILTVNGRTSGRPFSNPVAYFERDGGYLVVGSAGGLPQDPQWFKNLRAADAAVIELGDQRHDVGVRVLEGPERDDAFAQVVRESPGFADYETKSSRRMPVALLSPK